MRTRCSSFDNGRILPKGGFQGSGSAGPVMASDHLRAAVAGTPARGGEQRIPGREQPARDADGHAVDLHIPVGAGDARDGEAHVLHLVIEVDDAADAHRLADAGEAVQVRLADQTDHHVVIVARLLEGQAFLFGQHRASPPPPPANRPAT